MSTGSGKMSFGDYLRKWTYVKALIKGPPGSGKTCLAAGVGHLWKTLYIDVEGGLFSACPEINRENTEVYHIREQKAEDFFAHLAQAIEEAESRKYECVVLDSFTEVASRMEDDYAQKSASGKLEFGDWSDMLWRIKRFCRRLRDCACHVVVTCLTKPTGEESAGKIYELAIAGQSAAIVPSMFDTIGLMRKIISQKRAQYVFTTDGPMVYQVRDRYRSLDPDEVVEEGAAWKVWKKLADGISKVASR